DVRFGNNRWDAAAMIELLLGLRAGQSGLHDFDGGCRNIIFGAQGDDRAAAMKDVANQLERGGAHKAVWIDAKSHVVNGLATMDGLGNHELLVFGPGKLYGRWRRIRRIARGGLRRFEKTPDHGTKRIHGRRFRVFLVSREHGAKAIG